jgi:hypothetical protein
MARMEGLEAADEDECVEGMGHACKTPLPKTAAPGLSRGGLEPPGDPPGLWGRVLVSPSEKSRKAQK